MECELCKEGPCCPTHCCVWETCTCGDCEQCSKPQPAAVPQPPADRKASDASTTESVSSDRGYKSPSVVFSSYAEIEERVKEKMRKIKEEEDAERKQREDIRGEERKQYEAVMKSTKDFLESNKKVLSTQTIDSTKNTLDRLQGTLEGIKSTERKFQAFQDAYDKLLTGCLQNAMGMETESTEQLQTQFGKARGCELEEAAYRLSECRKVVIIVGAGVSVESGVPTYKGNDEKWDIDGKVHSGDMLTHEEMATARIMQSFPLEFWQKQHYTKMNMTRCQPNRTHYAVAELYNYYRHIGRSVSVITQNIDDYDRQVLGPDADVYEVHGNLSYMRCMTNCCDVLFPAPDTTEPLSTIPMCPACEGLARPHILLFDENYEEKWYKSDTAAQAAEEADCLLVLGTQLKTGLANRAVRRACRKPGTLVIEVNVEPVIEYGQVLVLCGAVGDVVPPLVGMTVQQAS